MPILNKVLLMSSILHRDLTKSILKLFYEVYNPCEVGLLLNFGKKLEFIRKVYQNNRK
jgi:hypothetical protein